MIRNFSDHSENERTFLAWVRTSIAVMAFGFLVEKFDLFLEFGAPVLAGRTLSLPGQKFGNIAGVAFIILGTVMVCIEGLQFGHSHYGRSQQFRQGNVNRTRSSAASFSSNEYRALIFSLVKRISLPGPKTFCPEEGCAHPNSAFCRSNLLVFHHFVRRTLRNDKNSDFRAQQAESSDIMPGRQTIESEQPRYHHGGQAAEDGVGDIVRKGDP
jgi:uncharacterized membrane protein YidH (DUF202 family)